MKYWFLFKEYIWYKLIAKSAHGIHSPFVYHFITHILQDERHFYAFDEINKKRQQLYDDNGAIEIEDFGAGSHTTKSNKRIIKDIARNAGRNEKMGKLLFRIVDTYQCKHILELGTSLGLGTMYLAHAAKNGKLISIEGSKEIAAHAKQSFQDMKLDQIEQVIGNFDDILSTTLKNEKPFDLIFVDGNHREEATIRYFNEILPYVQEDCILIFDDIHWSKGMRNAWEYIHQDARVNLSIDLFFIGLVFFKKEFKEKQHFVLKY